MSVDDLKAMDTIEKKLSQDLIPPEEQKQDSGDIQDSGNPPEEEQKTQDTQTEPDEGTKTEPDEEETKEDTETDDSLDLPEVEDKDTIDPNIQYLYEIAQQLREMRTEPQTQNVKESEVQRDEYGLEIPKKPENFNVMDLEDESSESYKYWMKYQEYLVNRKVAEQMAMLQKKQEEQELLRREQMINQELKTKYKLTDAQIQEMREFFQNPDNFDADVLVRLYNYFKKRKSGSIDKRVESELKTIKKSKEIPRSPITATNQSKLRPEDEEAEKVKKQFEYVNYNDLI